MRPFTTHTGRALPLRRDCVDTDQIVPAEFCKRVTKTGYEDALFARWRTDPDFVLDQPRYQGSTVLLAGREFGIGSSREHAVWALKDAGFAVVVATGFGDIFRRNAVNNGLLPVDLPEASVAGLMSRVETDPGTEIVADLESCELRCAEYREPFPVDPRSRRLMLQGLDTIAATLLKHRRIAAYERGRKPWLPALPERAAGGAGGRATGASS